MKHVNLLILAVGLTALGGWGIRWGGSASWRAKQSLQEVRAMSRFLIAVAALLLVSFAVSNLD